MTPQPPTMASGSGSGSSSASNADPIRVLFVCLGNICRSPMAHAVFEDMVNPSGGGGDGSGSATSATPAASFIVDSAGTGAYHEGSSPDRRTLTTLERHGIRGFQHAARKVRTTDFTLFDYVLAMDAENLEDLELVRARAARAGDAARGGEGAAATAADKAGGDAGSDVRLAKLALFGDYGGSKRSENIVDPYYGGGEGFETAYKQCVRFSKGLLAEIYEERSKRGSGDGSQ